LPGPVVSKLTGGGHKSSFENSNAASHMNSKRPPALNLRI